MYNRLFWVAALGMLSFNAGAQQMERQERQAFTLKEAITHGLQHHPSRRLYENSVAKSRQSARDALSAYLPQVSLQSSFDYNYKLQENIIPAGVFGPEEQRIRFGTKYGSNTVVQLDQTIYDQALITGLKANKPNTELAEIDVQSNNENLIYNIANAYYSVLVAKEQMILLNANKQRFTELLRIMNLQNEYGVVNKVDVDQVQVNLSNVESQLTILQNNMELSMNTLKNAMGLPQSASIVLSDSTSFVNMAITKQRLNTIQGFDYTKTLQYKQQMVMLDLYQINIERMKYEALPKLSLYARYGANGFGSETIKGAYDPLLDFGSMGLKLSWGIFTGFKRDAMYKTAKIEKDNALINLEINKDMMALQYHNSKVQWERAKSTIETNKLNVNLAQKVYDNTHLQYKEGVASLSQLLNAELALREANNNYSQSLIDYFKAELELNKSNGSLQQFYSGL